MSKKKNKFGNISCKAVLCIKVDSLLTEAFELNIENGQIVDATPLTRAADIPAASIGKAQTALWNQIRSSQNVKIREALNDD